MLNSLLPTTEIGLTVVVVVVGGEVGQAGAAWKQHWDMVLAPGQAAPPPEGGGLVHVLVLCWVAPVQVTTQLAQAVQSLQAPLTTYVDSDLEH